MKVENVYEHLYGVNAGPMLVLADPSWEPTHDPGLTSGVYRVPATISMDDLIVEIMALTPHARLESDRLAGNHDRLSFEVPPSPLQEVGVPE